ncbi:MAG: aminopeptidase P family protein [Pseudomonadota bacterium]
MTATSKKQGSYRGDAVLARLLAREKSGKSVADVRGLLAGVIAAPPLWQPDSWIELVDRNPDDELIGELKALKEVMAADHEDGLDAGPPAPAWRLQALREELERRGVDGFLIPRADQHQGEYVAARSNRLLWLTGFSGSAGLAVVLADQAAIFVDGRYTLQAADEVDGDHFEHRHLIEQPATDWITEHLGDGKTLAYDPWLHTPPSVRRLEQACAKAGGKLVALDSNPIDAVWSNQPAAPLTPAVVHPLDLAGRDSKDKIDEIAAALTTDGHGAAILSDPASVAWLLNLRGQDLPNTPFCLSWAIVEASGRVQLFVDRRKLTPALVEAVERNAIVNTPGALPSAIDALAAKGAPVRLDSASGPMWFADRIEKAGGTVVEGADPCRLPKACKNDVEVKGSKAAHVRDGAALTRFLHWLAIQTGPGSNQELDEIGVAERLGTFRAEGERYRGPSFDTISGAGPNGAIVHYHSTERTNRKLEQGDLYLVDSGGQYEDGTTDVTRTIAVGEPSDDQRRHFTAVLKGHIAIATARVPAGTSGAQIDALARAPLWQLGLDYDHGTGHGVGSYLAVHEGPQSISKRPSDVALKPGMIISNEPGYYKTGAYGIRIENLIVVRQDDTESERPMLRFETITKAPLDRRLIAVEELNELEIAWVDAYHRDVRETLTPTLDAATAAWLADVTRPLADGA